MRLTSWATLLLAGSTWLVNARPIEDPRADYVVNAFKHAWSGYRQYAWGHDELRPLTNGTSDSRNGWGASIFDGLDTMLIMGLEEEYQEALEHVKNVDWFSTTTPSKTFETNIRYLGGLLAAYDLRPDPVLLEKAIELAQYVLLPAYDTPNGIPAAYVDVKRGKPTNDKSLILAEFGSLQLEMVRLSQLTGDERYAQIANNVIYAIDNVDTPFPGVYPIIWDLDSFTPSSCNYYEYLLKTYLLTDGHEKQQLDMWKKSVDTIQTYLRSETSGSMVFLAEIDEDYKLLQTGELVCFIPGNILLGARLLGDSELTKFASELMKSCYDTWAVTPTGLAPETWSWIDKAQNISSFPEIMQSAMKTTGFIPQDVQYDLRPETIESIFYFYRLTGDPKYQDMAWKIFESIEKYCKTASGYTRVNDISSSESIQGLDFEESVMSLDEWVYSTEAHAFKLDKPIQVQAQF
ncbi:glycoside hydrolase [Phascolomyces articulosus]|uniref:alpha-1,2-Mannosidase n=1 Tax=Phascolomyces articulosus TaxID=60185 RepID=A0AAD5KBR1_9FUNG|nr:glycoside hydrolase [Phascolomyces articulosus]